MTAPTTPPCPSPTKVTELGWKPRGTGSAAGLPGVRVECCGSGLAECVCGPEVPVADGVGACTCLLTVGRAPGPIAEPVPGVPCSAAASCGAVATPATTTAQPATAVRTWARFRRRARERI